MRGRCGVLPGGCNPGPAVRALSIVSRELWRWVMVLQHAHSFSAASSPRLDVARIAAGAGTIALNVAVLLLLLIPACLPDLAAPPDRGMVVVPIVDRIIPTKPSVPEPVVKPVSPDAPPPPAPVRPDL